MSSNYPDNVDPNDPRAPWNAPDIPEFEPSCEGECDYCGIEFSLNKDGYCLECFEELQLDEGA